MLLRLPGAALLGDRWKGGAVQSRLHAYMDSSAAR